MLKVDFHTHTDYIQTQESRVSPKELIDKSKELGFDALAITEHYMPASPLSMFRQDPLKTYRDFKDYAEKVGIILIPGFEIGLEKRREVVVLNYTGDVSQIKNFDDLKKLKKEHPEILVFAPHPFFVYANCLGKKLIQLIDLFDAIEYCHFYTLLINRNKKAEKIAKAYNKPLIGTSDMHRIFQLNTTYSLVDAEKNVESILKAVKEGKVALQTKPLNLPTFLRIVLMSFVQKFKIILLIMREEGLV